MRFRQTGKTVLVRFAVGMTLWLISGVTHNIPLLRDIIMEKKFRKGETTTDYLTEVYPQGFTGTIAHHKFRVKPHFPLSVLQVNNNSGCLRC